MKPLARLALAALAFAAASPLVAQTAVNMPYNNGPTTHTLFSGPNTAFFNFYDNGGPAGNYSNGSNRNTSIATFVGPPGSTLRVTFLSFSTEASWDALYVYDGNSTASPMIASANGAGVDASCPSPGGWWGTGTPGNAGTGVVESTGNALTFQFCSDASVTFSGWAAIVALATDADLSTTLTASPASAVAGGTLTYVATVTNNGPDDAQDVTASVDLPAGVSLVSATPSAGGSCIPGDPVNCTWAGATAPASARTVTVVVSLPIDLTGVVDASATGSSSTNDPATGNNAASVSVGVLAPSQPIPALDPRLLVVLALAVLAMAGPTLARRG